MKLQAATRLTTASEDQVFKDKVADINSMLTKASQRAEALPQYTTNPKLITEARELEVLIDKARSLAFKLR